LQKLAGQKRARRSDNQIFAESWKGADAGRHALETVRLCKTLQAGRLRRGAGIMSRTRGGAVRIHQLSGK